MSRKPAVVEAPPEVATPEVAVETPLEQPVEETPVLELSEVKLGHVRAGKSYVKKIPVPLSGDPAKQIAAAQEIAKLERSVKALEDDKKATVKELSEAITGGKTRIQELAKQIVNDTIIEDVRVYEVLDYDVGVMRTMREDSGEVIETRPLCDKEKQAELPLDEEGRPDLDEEEPLPETEQNCAACADYVSCETRAADGGPCDKWAASPVEDEDEETPE